MAEEKTVGADQKEYDEVLSSYYKDEQTVKALITLKVDTKFADKIAAKVATFGPAEDVFLVTGDIDIIVKAGFETYNDLKKFLVSKLGPIEGVKETKTLMVVTTFKENGKAQENEKEDEEGDGE
jgi:DNA-binding Lrp family transcriptional regulator